jgi:hypothetical protein
MRSYILLYILAFFLAACTQNSGIKQANNSDQEIRKQVIEIAETSAKNKLKGANKKITKDGSIIYSTGDKKCVINPSYILIGEIDEDSLKDAIVSIFTIQGQSLPLKEHFILINKNGKLTIAKELDGEMKFLSISNRTIYIETSKMAPDSPYADCQLCKVIKTYKFIAGDTVGIK